MLKFGSEISMYNFEERDFIFFKRIIDSANILSKNLNKDLHLFQNEPKTDSELDFGINDFEKEENGIKKEDLNEYFKMVYPSIEPFIKISTPSSESFYKLNKNKNKKSI